MDIYQRRDTILKAILELGGDRVATDELAQTVEIEDLNIIYSDLNWMEGMELTKNLGAWGGQVLSTSLTTQGQNFVELGESVRLLAQSSVSGAIMNQQNNYNSGNAVNNMGDGNTTNFNVSDNSFQELVAALRDAKAEERAQELEYIAKTEGKDSAIKKLLQWVSNNWLTPAAMTAVQAVAAANGLF